MDLGEEVNFQGDSALTLASTGLRAASTCCVPPAMAFAFLGDQVSWATSSDASLVLASGSRGVVVSRQWGRGSRSGLDSR